MDGENIHAVVKAEGQSADAVALQQAFALGGG
jgi:hypothetical protein